MNTSNPSPPPEPAEPALKEAAPAARPIRLWPALAIIAVACAAVPLASLILAMLVPEPPGMRILPLMVGAPLFGLLLLPWWLFFSRIRWRIRFLGLGLIALATVIVFLLAHPSMHQFVIQHALPLTAFAAVLWTWIAVRWPLVHRAGLAGLVVAGAAVICLLRFDGMTGGFLPAFAYRFSRTPDQRAVDYFRTAGAKSDRKVTSIDLQEGDWPEFRGPRRDGVAIGAEIRTDWEARPPKMLWRHPVGLGWSSFAVVGGLAFTQEQRGDEELVVCYSAETGKQIWTHADTTRFSEAMGGDGPRATPTYHEGRIYAVGATGVLNCLEAAGGEHVWHANILKDAGAANLPWGMAGSPLVVGDLVIVNPGGPKGALFAYRLKDGGKAWSAGDETAGYSSPQYEVISGRPQVLIFDAAGVASYDPENGGRLWRFDRRVAMAHAAVQPRVVNDEQGRILVATSGAGTTMFEAQRDSEKWTTGEVWTSRGLKVAYNDLVTLDGSAYGFDEGILACIDLEDGKRRWKQGRYGYGQMLLVGKLLLVQAENGEVALVEANPSEFNELARFSAIEGKTWNHPVVVRGRLFVRNSEEAACYDVSR